MSGIDRDIRRDRTNRQSNGEKDSNQRATRTKVSQRPSASAFRVVTEDASREKISFNRAITQRSSSTQSETARRILFSSGPEVKEKQQEEQPFEPSPYSEGDRRTRENPNRGVSRREFSEKKQEEKIFESSPYSQGDRRTRENPNRGVSRREFSEKEQENPSEPSPYSQGNRRTRDNRSKSTSAATRCPIIFVQHLVTGLQEEFKKSET